MTAASVFGGNRREDGQCIPGAAYGQDRPRWSWDPDKADAAHLRHNAGGCIHDIWRGYLDLDRDYAADKIVSGRDEIQ